jgi:hypothetical protein
MSSLRRSCFIPLAAAAIFVAAACTRPQSTSDPVIRLVENRENPEAAFVEVAGTDRGTLRAVRRLDPTSDEWKKIFEVRILNPDGIAGAMPVAGRYAATGDVLRFTPMFPFDAGRQYEVRYTSVGLGSSTQGGTIRRIVARRAGPPATPTHVTHVFPSGPVVPENQLRMYIHFSAPMGRRGGLDHVKLLDEKRREVIDPFLPLDAEFWNDDRTRYTLFFDPGRQKRGILPNRQMGPSLVAGHSYTLVVDRNWIDGNGNPLRETFERTFRVGGPALEPLDYRSWRVTPPAQGTRDPIAVDFPEPLDQGLLLRAIGVKRDGQAVAGEIRVEADETRWTLTPTEVWAPGRYELIVLSILEDLAGNRIGRAFEVAAFARDEGKVEPDVTSIAFDLAAASH